jgi:hypothetical protein
MRFAVSYLLCQYLPLMDCSSGMSGTLGTWGYMGRSSKMPGTLGTWVYGQYRHMAIQASLLLLVVNLLT